MRAPRVPVSISVLVASAAVVLAQLPAAAAPLAALAPVDPIGVGAQPLADAGPNQVRPSEPGAVLAVDGEVTSLRTETSSTFIVKDPLDPSHEVLQARVSAVPVHVLDAAGKWQDIDTSLAGDGRGGAKARRVPFGLTLPASLLTAPVVVTGRGVTLGLQLQPSVSGVAPSVPATPVP